MHYQRWSVAAVLLLCGIEVGCVPGTEPSEDDAGGGSGYLTDLPGGWGLRCEEQQFALPACSAIEDASGADAERLAFELNLEASDQGIFPPGLGELHFAHGRFAGWTVRDLATALTDPNSSDAPPSDLDDLCVAVNRAFVDGVDAGALAVWVTTPLCGAAQPPGDTGNEGTTGTIEGPAPARCGLLDGECARGVYHAAGECCTVELAAVGAACGDGLCAADGRCLPARAVPDEERVHGALTWLEVLSGGDPLVWHLESGLVRVAVAEQGDLTQAPPPQVADEDWESWEAHFGALRGRPVGQVAASLEGAVRVHVGRSVDTSVAASALHVPGGVAALAVEGAPPLVCVVAGRDLDQLAPVMSDCSIRGATLLACPGELDGLSCVVEEGHAVVRGKGLALAFAAGAQHPIPSPDDPLPLPNDPIDNQSPARFHAVFPWVFPHRVCAGFGCARRLDGDFWLPGGPGVIRPRRDRGCSLSGRCRGRFFCQAFVGCFCTAWPERCNGVDDDCDGATDEGATALCDDGIACTGEQCAGALGCMRTSAGWNGAFCSSAFCAKGVCNGERPPNVNPSLPLTPGSPDANGCQVALDNNVCENVIDRCTCNGTSVCDPSAATTEGPLGQTTGCSQTSIRATPLPTWPCEQDGDLCTNEVCCEPNPGCRYLNPRLRQPAGSTAILRPDNPACTNLFVPHRPGRAIGSGPVPSCVRMESLQTLSQRVQVHCNDAQPCTVGSCASPATGRCTQTPLASPARPAALVVQSPLRLPVTLDMGCFRELEQGCGQEQCALNPLTNTSRCVVVGGDHVRFDNTVPGGCGTVNPHDAVSEYEYPDPCLESFCQSSRCVTTPHDEYCDDDLICTVDRCDANLGRCAIGREIAAGTCRIDGVCWAEAQEDPTDQFHCRVCLSDVSQTAWSQKPECVL